MFDRILVRPYSASSPFAPADHIRPYLRELPQAEFYLLDTERCALED
jgi:hypothetical protein